MGDMLKALLQATTAKQHANKVQQETNKHTDKLIKSLAVQHLADKSMNVQQGMNVSSQSSEQD